MKEVYHIDVLPFCGILPSIQDKPEVEEDMKKQTKVLLIVASAIIGCASSFPAFAQVTEWKAIAGLKSVERSLNAWGYIGTGPSEDSAKAAVLTVCEQNFGRTCVKRRSTSVPMSWYLVVSSCDGAMTTGGSKYGKEAANVKAGEKVGRQGGAGCNIIWIIEPGCAKQECAMRDE
jgi:hypothetical protein